MKENHTSFCRMSCTWEVGLRLFSRNAINDQQNETFVRRYIHNGPYAANGNDTIMLCLLIHLLLKWSVLKKVLRWELHTYIFKTCSICTLHVFLYCRIPHGASLQDDLQLSFPLPKNLEGNWTNCLSQSCASKSCGTAPYRRKHQVINTRVMVFKNNAWWIIVRICYVNINVIFEAEFFLLH